MNPWAIPSLATAILSAYVGVYVLYKNPRSTLNRLFALLALAVTVWCFGQFVHRITPGATSLMWYRISGFGWCFVASIVLHFALVFARTEKILRNKLVYLVLYGPSIVFLYLGWSTDLIFQLKITETPWGNTCLPGDLAWTYTIYVFLYTVLAAYFCSRVYKESAVSIKKKQSLILTVAFLTPLVISGTTDLILQMMGIVVMELAALSCAVAVVIVAIAILKYKLFIIEPAAEETKLTEPVYDLPAGNSYLIKEPRTEKSFKVFTDLVTHGIEGLCITRLHPSIVRKRYGLEKTAIVWISRYEKAENIISPSSLGVLADTIADFVARSKNSVVLLEGLEYLILNTDFSRIFRMLSDVDRTIAERKSRLILPVNPSLLEKDEIALLEAHTKPLPQTYKKQSD